MVRIRDPAQADEGIDGAERRSRPPRHRPVAWATLPVGALGIYTWGTWGAVPFFSSMACSTASLGFPLARMRPRHGVQDALV